MAFYNNHLEQIGRVMYTGVAVPSGTIKMALMTTTYTFVDTHAFYSDLTGEASGTGYTAGGQAIDSIAVTQNDTANSGDIDFADEVFTGVSLTNVNGYVLYYDTGVAGTSQLISYTPFTEGAQTFANATFTVAPPSAGGLRIAAV